MGVYPMVITGEARGYWARVDMETECGAYCKCGATLVIKNKDRSFPITRIKCPDCGFIAGLWTGTECSSDDIRGFFTHCNGEQSL